MQDALRRELSPSSAYLTRRGLFSIAQVKQLVSAEIWEEGSKFFDPILHIAARADYNGSAVEKDAELVRVDEPRRTKYLYASSIIA